MISYNTLLKEIEKQIQLAKSTNQTSELREHLNAIRALCDVGLVQQTNEETPMQMVTNEQKKLEVTPTSFSTQAQRILDDEDGNGASIFDF